MYVIVGVDVGVSTFALAVGSRLWIKTAVDTAPSRPGTSPLGVNCPTTVTSPSPLPSTLSSVTSLPESVGSGVTDVNCSTTLLRSVKTAEVVGSGEGSGVGSGVNPAKGVSAGVVSLVNVGENVGSSAVDNSLVGVGSTLVENWKLFEVVDSSVVNDWIDVLDGVATDDHVLEVVGSWDEVDQVDEVEGLDHVVQMEEVVKSLVVENEVGSEVALLVQLELELEEMDVEVAGSVNEVVHELLDSVLEPSVVDGISVLVVGLSEFEKLLEVENSVELEELVELEALVGEAIMVEASLLAPEDEDEDDSKVLLLDDSGEVLAIMV